MSETFRVRRAVAADDRAVGELLVSAYLSGYARKMPEVVLSEQRKADLRDVSSKRQMATVLVLEEAQRIVGTVAVFAPGAPGSEAWLPDAADLRHLATDPSVHGRGFSHRLLDAAETVAATELGAKVMCLHVRRGNRGVAELYQRRGYARDPDGDLELPEVSLVAYVLTLRPR